MELVNQFLDDIPEAIDQFPELVRAHKNGATILAGAIDLVAEDGVLVDRYQIEIHGTINYPKSYPLLYEVGGRIPWNIDYHVYPDGHCCLTVPVQERLDCSKGLNLSGFIQKQVQGFLFSQTFRIRNGYFHRERAHGLEGRIQFYKEHLGLQNEHAMFAALAMIAENKEQGPHSPCFCGSQRKFQKCHRRAVRELNKAAGDLVIDDFNEMLKAVAEYKRRRNNNN